VSEVVFQLLADFSKDKTKNVKARICVLNIAKSYASKENLQQFDTSLLLFYKSADLINESFPSEVKVQLFYEC
jgi:hypothetical protein